MHMKVLCFWLTFLLVIPTVCGQGRARVRKSTDVLMFVPVAAGFATTLALRDYDGLKQLALGGSTALAASYLLELCIKKDRPDGDGHHAFPSTHTVVAFQGAAFILRRYGWQYGIPAYLLAGYVGWGRIYARRHDIWDVLAGAAIGVAGSYIFTRPLARDVRLSLMPATFGTSHVGFHASLRF